MKDVSDNSLRKKSKSVGKKFLMYAAISAVLIGTIDYMDLPSRLMNVYDFGKNKVVDAFTIDNDERYVTLIDYVDSELEDMPKEFLQRFSSKYTKTDSMINYKAFVDSVSMSGIDSILMYASHKNLGATQRMDYSKMFFDGLSRNDKWKFTKYATKDLAVDIFNKNE